MSGSLKATLQVNQTSIEMEAFVQDFVGRTALGMVTSLNGVDDVQTLQIRQQKHNAEITVNGEDIALTAFPNDIICNTLTALASSLKGVDVVDSLDISVEVQ